MPHRPQGAGHFFCYSCPTQPCVGPAVCELKTRTKDANIEAELTYVCENNLNRFHHVTTLDEFHPRVEEPENRVQLMHHLGARGRRFGLHVVARPGTIMRVVLLEISEEQRAAYMAAITALWENYMTPFEEVATIPAAFRNYDLGHIDTFRNLQFAVAFRNGLRETIREGGPLPDSLPTHTAAACEHLEQVKGWDGPMQQGDGGSTR